MKTSQYIYSSNELFSKIGDRRLSFKVLKGFSWNDSGYLAVEGKLLHGKLKVNRAMSGYYTYVEFLDEINGHKKVILTLARCAMALLTFVCYLLV